MKRYIKIIVCIAVMVIIFVTYAFYSRPMTILQRYPMLNLDKCTEIRCYYHDGTQIDKTQVIFEKNSEGFKILCDLFYKQEFSANLKNIFPHGTRYHQEAPGDFQWDVYFCFEKVELPDGNFGSGTLFHIQNWYGDLDLYFDGDALCCNANDQELWVKEILDTIRN